MVRGSGMERDAHTGGGAVRVVHMHMHGVCGQFSPCDAEAGRGCGQLTRALPMSPPAASRCTIISSVTASPLEARPPGSG